jgi:hypothetical protein
VRIEVPAQGPLSGGWNGKADRHELQSASKARPFIG